MKDNCWDIMQCNQNIKKECPATTSEQCNGIHGGVNGGRCCWQISGTFCEDVMLCGGTEAGIKAKDITSCIFCEVYIRVKLEEGKNFKMMNKKVPLNINKGIE